jgi:hypothetical protein
MNHKVKVLTVLLAMGCGSKPAGSLSVSVDADPDQSGDGHAIVTVVAAYRDGSLGDGKVTLFSDYGDLGGTGPQTQTLTLDKGLATATLDCSADLSKCIAPKVRVAATWDGLEAESGDGNGELYIPPVSYLPSCPNGVNRGLVACCKADNPSPCRRALSVIDGQVISISFDESDAHGKTGNTIDFPVTFHVPAHTTTTPSTCTQVTWGISVESGYSVSWFIGGQGFIAKNGDWGYQSYGAFFASTALDLSDCQHLQDGTDIGLYKYVQQISVNANGKTYDTMGRADQTTYVMVLVP